MKRLHKHLYKSVSYRILSITITFVIALALTGNTSLAGSIASVDAVIKFVVYFAHERAWSKLFKHWKEA
jgi:uncharacterized membrane protein